MQYRSFSALSEWVKVVTLTTGCSKRVTEPALRGQLFLDKLRREHPGWKTIWGQEWGLFLLECSFHNATAMWRREQQQHTQRCPHQQQTAMANGMALEHPSVRTLLGSTDPEILNFVEQVYRGQCKVAPSILPCRYQDQFMAKLHEELSQCLVRARFHGVMGTVQSLSRHIRSREWQYQSQSLGHQQPSEALPCTFMRRPHRSTSLSPNPPCPHCADE